MIMILLYIVLLSYRRTLTKTTSSRLDALVAAFYVHLSTTANPSTPQSKVEGMPLERLYQKQHTIMLKFHPREALGDVYDIDFYSVA